MANGVYCSDHSGYGERIKGCEGAVIKLEAGQKETQELIRKMYHALIGAALSFAVAALMLGINLASG